MKLVAVWIEKFMKIEKQGFNLGCHNTFAFEFNSQERILTVESKKTKNYYDLFESDQSISNISGLLGLNGAGKTTFIKLLNVIKAKKPLEFPVILIYEKTDNSGFRVFNYRNLDLGLPKNQIQISGADNFEYAPLNAYPFEEVDVVFYSNLYSNQTDLYLSQLDDNLNRSVDYQTRLSLSDYRVQSYLTKYNKEITEKERKESGDFVISSPFNVLSLYFDDRWRRMFKFLSAVNIEYPNIKGVVDQIKFPSSVNVWTNTRILSETEELIRRSNYDFSHLIDIYEVCRSNNKSVSDPKMRLRNEIIYQLFYFVFYTDELKHSKDRGGSLNELVQFSKSLPQDSSIFLKLENFLKAQYTPLKMFVLERINSLVNNLDNYMDGIVVQELTGWHEKGVYQLEINEKLWTFLSEITSIVDYNYEGLFNYNLPPLSAGEMALLNQFSEFYEAFESTKKDFVLVTIDEGELFLHPEWQRQYIDSLYKFFRYFSGFQGNRVYQIILSSHSPFIASDIPRHNLVFLDRDKETGKCLVTDPEKHKPTFGGNIFELFADGFFVEEFFGTFATNRINQAFEELQKKTISKETLRRINAFKNLIGEEIIRSELEAMVRQIDPDFLERYDIIESDDIEITDDHKKPNRILKFLRRFWN